MNFKIFSEISWLDHKTEHFNIVIFTWNHKILKLLLYFDHQPHDPRPELRNYFSKGML